MGKRVGSGRVVGGKVVIKIGGVEYTAAELLEMKKNGRKGMLNDYMNGNQVIETITVENEVAAAVEETKELVQIIEVSIEEEVVSEPAPKWYTFAPGKFIYDEPVKEKGFFARLKEVFTK